MGIQEMQVQKGTIDLGNKIKINISTFIGLPGGSFYILNVTPIQ